MDDKDLIKLILDNELDAREQFVQRYSDAILRGLLRKCRKNCSNLGCPLRHALTQQNLERTRCDELGNLYVFSLESIFKALESYHGNEEGLDKWMHHQTNPNGILFRQRFAAYMAAKYPITGRARIPDRFQKRWTSIQKQIYKGWLRQYTVHEMAVKARLSEDEVIEIMEDIIEQLREAGLLASLQTGVNLETFQERERRTRETTSNYTPMDMSN
ncbi:hypothetical protein FJZ33_12120, partial [Candidatus Poribacteria bacterium]|nr:hypothetical protein [Candidatus Poribacteria bacterium]